MRNGLLSCLLTLLSVPTYAQESGPGGRVLPTTEELGRAYATICRSQAQGATLGFAGRVDGRTLDSMMTRLREPQEPAKRQIVLAMKQTVRDVYAYPEVAYYTMFFYRSHVCFRELTELRSLPPIEGSIPKLLECQKQHGTKRSGALFQCIKQVVAQIAP